MKSLTYKDLQLLEKYEQLGYFKGIVVKDYELKVNPSARDGVWYPLDCNVYPSNTERHPITDDRGAKDRFNITEVVTSESGTEYHSRAGVLIVSKNKVMSWCDNTWKSLPCCGGLYTRGVCNFHNEPPQ